MEDGAFFDQYGYYFDTDGFDELGGFYSEDTGEYVSPDMYTKLGYQEYYDELVGEDTDEEGGSDDEDQGPKDEYNISEEEVNKN